MARSIGRPMAVLVLSDEERSYLERQVRRRRVARSISDRCRILLEQNDEWAVSRRYMTLESIAPLSDGVPITLPTVAA